MASTRTTMTLPASRQTEKERARQSDKEPEETSRIIGKARKRKGFCNTIHREEKNQEMKKIGSGKKEGKKEKNERKRTNKWLKKEKVIVNIS